jgi:hypothetical protein
LNAGFCVVWRLSSTISVIERNPVIAGMPFEMAIAVRVERATDIAVWSRLRRIHAAGQ